MAFRPCTEEPSNRPDRARIRARIGGLHCSLCVGTIEKALGRQPGVDKIAVSLTHEQALVEYDPKVARPEALLNTLRDTGYTVSDPRKRGSALAHSNGIQRARRRAGANPVGGLPASPQCSSTLFGGARDCSLTRY